MSSTSAPSDNPPAPQTADMDAPFWVDVGDYLDATAAAEVAAAEQTLNPLDTSLSQP